MDYDQILGKLQATQTEILSVIDRICREHGVSYSLYAGSLLGAVRHQGFIPWDDDLDICMERSEYDRFLAAWKESPPEGFILQNKENTPSFTQSFSKIRKEHSTFLQYDWEASKYHTGIFVDVFPMDRMPRMVRTPRISRPFPTDRTHRMVRAVRMVRTRPHVPTDRTAETVRHHPRDSLECRAACPEATLPLPMKAPIR